MILLNPKKHSRKYPDAKSREIMLKTIEFFEQKGIAKIKHDDQQRIWYRDFLDFQKKEKLFATLLTPAAYADGDPDKRWDTYRICEFNEILGFYGLPYWYTWQVSILGLGPIWMTKNEALKKQAAKLIDEGGIFAFGLSEKDHGADIYSTAMKLVPQPDGTYLANGRKYYIGNGNEAAMVSTFGRIAEPDGTVGKDSDYAFFVAHYDHENYDCVQNVINSQSYVSEYALLDYPITEADMLAKGPFAWDCALNTVNIGKYNLGWASIGMCTHALYEAIHHAANRNLYGMWVTDFPHVKQAFVDAYSRLVAMKLFALRASDYMRAASKDDRRYMLFNPAVKMKVTTQGEQVIDLMWDVIAAKGFEKDTFFEMAARDIRALPKLEGTVHVNVALILKFMPNYFFNPGDFPELPLQDQTTNDDFLFDQGPTKGLGKVQFGDYEKAYALYDTPNLRVFKEQIAVFKESLFAAGPSDAQKRDIDFLLAIGELFTLVVYGQLILENGRLMGIDEDHIDQIFDFLVRDFSAFALQTHNKPSSTEKQMEYCIKMIRKPAVDHERYDRMWKNWVYPLKDAYEMNE